MAEKRADVEIKPSSTRVWRLLWLHPVQLISRLLAEHAQPRNLGVAGAFGALVGTLPFIGLHTVLVYMGARRFMLNRIVALGANQLGMPPIIPGLCIEVGYYVRHGTWLTEVSMRTLGREAPQRFWEWMIGSLFVGPALAAVVGGGVWLLAALVQRRIPVAGCGAVGGEGEPRKTGD